MNWSDTQHMARNTSPGDLEDGEPPERTSWTLENQQHFFSLFLRVICLMLSIIYKPKPVTNKWTVLALMLMLYIQLINSID